MSQSRDSLLSVIEAALEEFSQPEHPDALRIWPTLLPLYCELLQAEYLLRQDFPGQANLCGRMADALREQMIDAELGLLSATPEQRVKRALEAEGA